MFRFFAAVLALLSLTNVSGFYLPGVAPHNYVDGEEVVLKVNKLSSVHTQLPYDFYSLKFCQPKGGVKPYSENLGEFLSGDRIENSAYEVRLAHTPMLVAATAATVSPSLSSSLVLFQWIF